MLDNSAGGKRKLKRVQFAKGHPLTQLYQKMMERGDERGKGIDMNTPEIKIDLPYQKD